jgi:hypothetical protein
VIVRRLLLGLLVVLAASYAVLPSLVAFVLPRILAPAGVSDSHFSIGYPGWRSVAVENFDMRIGDVAIAGERGRITYRLAQLFQGRCDAVTLSRLTVHLGGGQSAPPTAPFEIPPFWALVPAERVSIEQVDFASVNPAAEAHGTLHFDPDVLETRLSVQSPQLALPLMVSATTYPDGRFAVSVTQQDVAEPLLALTGVPDEKHETLVVDGHIALSGTPLALVAAYADTTLASGDVSVRLEGSTPWPIHVDSAWRRFTGRGNYAVSGQGRMDQVPDLFAELRGTFEIRDGTLSAQLDAGSSLRGELPALQPFVGTDLPRVTVAADTVVNAEYGDQGLRIHDGLVVSLPVAGSAASVRVRGARSADGGAELAVTTFDGAPVVLATARPADVDGAAALAVHAQVALAGKLFGLAAAAAGAADSAGHLVTDFDGTVPWPLDDAALQTVSGKGRLSLASKGRIGDGEPFDASVESEYTLERGRFIAKVEPGAHVRAAGGIEATTIGAVTIDALLASGQTLASRQVDVQGFDFKFAVPAIEVGKRKLTLSDAWVTTERLTCRGDAIAAQLTVRTHAGRDALPARLTLAYDLAKRAGDFSVSIDWVAKKPLLAKQLPGFNAPFDIDEGKLLIEMTGSWDMARESPLRGAGRIRLDAQRAHFEDDPISGISADLPIKLDGGFYTIAASPVAIENIDVGFPLTRVALNVAVADKIAQVRDLNGSVLGGVFSADPFDYVLATDEAHIELRVTAIDLAHVLALEGDDVQGSGLLDGRLPVRMAGDVVSVRGGTLAARAPGGTLVYKGAAASAMAAQSGMGFVFQALEDFRYDVLDAKVELATDGALALAVRLQGRNPAVENGRTIAFNLNLTESLPALLQSLRAADGITKQIEGRLSQ